METLPQDWIALASLVFVLGMKHGFDADHLATIDGLTRYNARSNPALARLCGALFSLGHGSVVLAIALLVCTLAGKWKVPEWMAVFGAWVLIALVGSLFSLSFDTLSQAALFAFSATQYGGWEHALTLGLLFMLGMLVTDGINGLWISRLIRRADQTALVASRVMGLVVSGVSLLVASFGIAKFVSPEIDAWSAGKELVFGCLLMAIIAGSYFYAVRLTRRAVLV